MLPSFVLFAIEMLEKRGFEAFAVGGCVRDIIMGTEPHDYDITTSATPDEILSVFRAYTTFDIGKQHGTIMVSLENTIIEITTYRIDGEYLDGRRPSSVRFTKSLNEDLKRRDFTINAIAYNPKVGFIDLFNGQYDIKNKIIRTIGDGYKRFDEDALRILRAFRFSAQLDFKLTNQTYNDIMLAAQMVKTVSKERISSELSKILTSKDPQRVLTLMCELDVLKYIIPEFKTVKNFSQCGQIRNITLDKHIFTAISLSNPNLVLRLSLLFHDIAKPICMTRNENGVYLYPENGRCSAEIAEQRLTELRFERQIIDRVTALIRYQDAPLNCSRPSIKRCLSELGTDGFLLFIQLKRSDLLAQGSKRHQAEIKVLEHMLFIAKDISDKDECYSIEDLAINGHILQRLGVPEGRLVGQVLHKLLDYVIEDNTRNIKDELMDMTRELVKQIV